MYLVSPLDFALSIYSPLLHDYGLRWFNLGSCSVFPLRLGFVIWQSISLFVFMINYGKLGKKIEQDKRRL